MKKKCVFWFPKSNQIQFGKGCPGFVTTCQGQKMAIHVSCEVSSKCLVKIWSLLKILLQNMAPASAWVWVETLGQATVLDQFGQVMFVKNVQVALRKIVIIKIGINKFLFKNQTKVDSKFKIMLKKKRLILNRIYTKLQIKRPQKTNFPLYCNNVIFS